MPSQIKETRTRTFSGTKRRIYHLIEAMGTSGDQVWPFASQPFMRSPGPLSPERTEEWHLGIHAVLVEAVAEERIVWKFLNEGVDGTHGFYLSSSGKQTTLEIRVEATLSDTDGRLFWRRVEDAFDRSAEALFDKLGRVLKR